MERNVMKTYLTLLSIITAVALVSAADEGKPAPKKPHKRHPAPGGTTNNVPGTTNYVPGTGTTNWNRPMTPPQPVQPAKPYVPTPPQPVQPPRPGS